MTAPNETDLTYEIEEIGVYCVPSTSVPDLFDRTDIFLYVNVCATLIRSSDEKVIRYVTLVSPNEETPSNTFTIVRGSKRALSASIVCSIDQE